jgi:hypothetical protein
MSDVKQLWHVTQMRWRNRKHRAVLAGLARKFEEKEFAYCQWFAQPDAAFQLPAGFNPDWPGLLHYQLMRVGVETQLLVVWHSEEQAREGARRIPSELHGFALVSTAPIVAVSAPKRQGWPTTVGGNLERLAALWGTLATLAGAIVFLFMPPKVAIVADTDAGVVNAIEGTDFKVIVRLTNPRRFTSVDVHTVPATAGRVDREYVSIKAGDTEQVVFTGPASSGLTSLTLTFHEKAGSLWWAHDETRDIAFKVWRGLVYDHQFSLQSSNDREAALAAHITPIRDKPLECLASVARMPSVWLISASPSERKMQRNRNLTPGKEFESLSWYPPVSRMFQPFELTLKVRQNGASHPWPDVARAVMLECAQ